MNIISNHKSERYAISKNKWLYKSFVFFCFFPYVQLVPLGTDSQPYALLLGSLFLMIYRPRRFVRELFYLFIVMIWSIVLVLFSKLDFNSIRSLINYISLFVISSVTYFMLRRWGFLQFSSFRKIIYIWGAAGLIQQFLFPKFGAFLISRMSGSSISGRGVTSLAPEPTFYAIICVLFSIVCFLNYRNQIGYRKVQFIIWGQVLFLSRSSTVLLITVAAYSFYKIILSVKKDPRVLLKLIIGAVISLVIVKFLITYVDHYRFGHLLKNLLENPQLFVTVDESVNERFIHAFFPIYGFIINWGIPHFYGHFSEFINEIVSSGNFSEYIPYVKNSYSRIMSGIGSALFELGTPGVLILIVLRRCIYALDKYDSFYLLYGLMFLFILINAMPLSNAMVGFVFGNLIYNKYKCFNSENLS